MTPLRVTFRVGTAMVDPVDPIHFDSLLAWCAVEEVKCQGPFTFEQVLDNLPLEREEREEGWVWKASQLIEGRRMALEQRYLSRKFWSDGYADLFGRGLIAIGAKGEPSVPTDPATAIVRPENDLDRRVFRTDAAGGAIDTERGHLKNASFLYPVVHVDTLTAFCVGDAERIEALLRRHLHFIGKRARLGHGQILEMSFLEDPGALRLWEQRVLPWQRRPDDLRVQSPLRPPYWQGERAVECWAPMHPTEGYEEPLPYEALHGA